MYIKLGHWFLSHSIATTVHQTGSLVSFTFYPISCSVITLPFNTTMSQLLIVLLNKNIRQMFVNWCAPTLLWYAVLVVTFCCLLAYLLIRSSFVKWTVQHNLLFCVLPDREGHSPKVSKWEFYVTNQIMDENQMMCHTYLLVSLEFSHTFIHHQWQWKC
jgi:hypothetical protein